jgi:hypothetical protein
MSFVVVWGWMMAVVSIYERENEGMNRVSCPCTFLSSLHGTAKARAPKRVFQVDLALEEIHGENVYL